MIRAWEYRSIYLSGIPEILLLQKPGDEGWELVVWNTFSGFAIFKREKAQPLREPEPPEGGKENKT